MADNENTSKILTPQQAERNIAERIMLEERLAKRISQLSRDRFSEETSQLKKLRDEYKKLADEKIASITKEIETRKETLKMLNKESEAAKQLEEEIKKYSTERANVEVERDQKIDAINQKLSENRKDRIKSEAGEIQRTFLSFLHTGTYVAFGLSLMYLTGMQRMTEASVERLGLVTGKGAGNLKDLAKASTDLGISMYRIIDEIAPYMLEFTATVGGATAEATKDLMTTAYNFSKAWGINVDTIIDSYTNLRLHSRIANEDISRTFAQLLAYSTEAHVPAPEYLSFLNEMADSYHLIGVNVITAANAFDKLKDKIIGVRQAGRMTKSDVESVIRGISGAVSGMGIGQLFGYGALAGYSPERIVNALERGGPGELMKMILPGIERQLAATGNTAFGRAVRYATEQRIFGNTLALWAAMGRTSIGDIMTNKNLEKYLSVSDRLQKEAAINARDSVNILNRIIEYVENWAKTGVGVTIMKIAPSVWGGGESSVIPVR